MVSYKIYVGEFIFKMFYILIVDNDDRKGFYDIYNLCYWVGVVVYCIWDSFSFLSFCKVFCKLLMYFFLWCCF